MALLRKQLSATAFKSSSTTNLHYSKQQSLPPGSITEFVWKDYSSNIFRNIQELGDVSYDDYLVSVRRHEILMELSLRGGYGRSFFLCHDQRFVIKTLRKSEAKVLIEMLPSYYAHLRKHEKTLLAKFYGLHAARPGIGGPKVYFVVMENLLQSELQIHRQYDLKGSSQGRSPIKAEDQTKITLKDPDFDLCFFLEPSTRSQLLEQIQLDCKFLEEQGVMGYSLLLGIHIDTPRRVTTGERENPESVNAEQTKEPTLYDSKQSDTEVDPSSPKGSGSHNRSPTLSDFYPEDIRSHSSRFGAKLSARAIHLHLGEKESMSLAGSRKSRIPEGSIDVYLFMGVIDFMQNYNVIKRIEHAYKSLQYDSKTISSVHPKLYATRFQDFLSKVFLPEASSPRSEAESWHSPELSI